MILRLIPFNARDGEILIDIGDSPNLVIELGKYARLNWNNEQRVGQTECLEAPYLLHLEGLSVKLQGERPTGAADIS